MIWFSSFLAVCFSLCITLCQAYFPPIPDNFTLKQGFAGVSVRYKEVPLGICETVEGVRSFSGYLDVGRDQHLFFWFVEARTGSPEEAPLTVWLNGGPGSSSLIGLFQEHGPCSIRNGQAIRNDYSWNNVSNMLYIDQPVGVGLSYSKAVAGYVNENYYTDVIGLPKRECPDYAKIYLNCGIYSITDATLISNSSSNAAYDFWKAIQGFMGAFPQYSDNEFHFATESFGGRYIPIYSNFFLQQNKLEIPDTRPICLKTVTIINGWMDARLQSIAYYNFSLNPGNTFDISPFNQTIQEEVYNLIYGPGNCLDQLDLCVSTGRDDACSQADTFCLAYAMQPFITVSARDTYDIRELDPDPFPSSDYKDYLNTRRIQEAIGAYVNYSDSNQQVYDTFATTGDASRSSLVRDSIQKLLENNISVTLWAGDADWICNWLGVEAVANSFKHKGYSKAGYADIETSDQITHGQTRQSGHFSFSRIFNAGHEVPFYQPLAALSLFNRSIHRVDIATGKREINSNYRTKGPHHSAYRQGNGTVQYTLLSNQASYNTTLNGPNPSTVDVAFDPAPHDSDDEKRISKGKNLFRIRGKIYKESQGKSSSFKQGGSK